MDQKVNGYLESPISRTLGKMTKRAYRIRYLAEPISGGFIENKSSKRSPSNRLNLWMKRQP